MPESSFAIQCDLLCKNYGQRRALTNLSLSVKTGEVFGVLGPNGGGKSTLFRILCTAMKADSGQARIQDIDVAQKPNVIRHRIGVVFQHPALDRKLTVWENLKHQGHLYGIAGSRLQNRVEELLKSFALLDRANDLVEKLSGGLARRVELAKSLIHKPQILLMDEPHSGLDPGARKDFWDILSNLARQEKVTVLLTTHLLEVADKCDRIGIICKGELVALGKPNELKNELGVDVMYIQSTKDPSNLLQRIVNRFQCEGIVMEGMIRIERRDGHNLVKDLMESFSSEIQSIQVGKPSLEDVFIRHTGHRFFDGEN